MSLQAIIKKCVVKELIDLDTIDTHCKIPNYLNKLLIVDSTTLIFLRELIKPSELTEKGFISIQDIKVLLQPLAIHLIYFVHPTVENFQLILDVFAKASCPFLSANIFCPSTIPDAVMKMIKSNSVLVSKIMNLKEFHISFTVEGPNVVTLGPHMTIPFVYSQSSRESTVKDISQRIVDLFTIMNDCPSIRFMASSELSENVADKLSAALSAISEQNPNFGKEGTELKKNACLILERNFDPRAPFIHYLTTEPIARDLLEIEDDFVEFNKNSKNSMRMYFTDPDPVWQSFRFMHIAEVMAQVNIKVKEFSSLHKVHISDEKVTVSSLRSAISKFPAFRSEFKRFELLTLLSNAIMDKYKELNLKEIVSAEQELATNENSKGEPVPDNPALYVNLLGDIKSKIDRFRLISLFALKNDNGLSKAILDKLFKDADIDFAKQALSAFETLGFPIIADRANRRMRILPRCSDSSVSTGYDDSRFIPVIWDILKQFIGQNLDESLFPFKGRKSTLTLSVFFST
uniref:Syntaxin-binding protein 2 (Trinotate prediction) n=1 Tax=Myxobolus squamalis TaxID=59785 RepID=A0A6B2FWJ9_MYXSQ